MSRKPSFYALVILGPDAKAPAASPDQRVVSCNDPAAHIAIRGLHVNSIEYRGIDPHALSPLLQNTVARASASWFIVSGARPTIVISP